MSSRRFGFLMQLLIISGSSMASEPVQHWLNFSASGKVTSRWNAVVANEFRSIPEDRALAVSRQEVTLIRNLNRNWKTGLGYELYFMSKSSPDWTREHRLRFDLSHSRQWGDWLWGERSRLEYRILETDRVFRYRQKLSVQWSRPARLNPYAAYDGFYQFDDKHYHRSRWYVGLLIKGNGPVGWDFYGMVEDNKSGETWTHTPVLGTRLNLKW